MLKTHTDARGRLVAEVGADQFFPWQPSVQQVRDVVLRHQIVGPDFVKALNLRPEAAEFVPDQREIEIVNECCHQAVHSGRFFDFGHLPNAAIQYGGKRGGRLWQQRALAMPFNDPWMLMHTWEDGVSVYLVNPRDGGVEIAELTPVRLGTEGSLILGDRGCFWFTPPDDGDKRYFVSMAPAAIRYQRDPEDFASANNGADDPRVAAAGNIGDPVMTAVLMLNTRNVERETIRADAKLQHARRKSGKAPIPDYERVTSLPYVTAITLGRSDAARGEDKGGTHRSPVPHVRHGHPRQYASGRSIFIRDTLVGVPADQREAFKSQRTHYDVRP